MKRNLILTVWVFVTFLYFNLLVAAPDSIFRYSDRVHPDIADSNMVVSQNQIATEVGYQILEQGGNAVDAATAIGFALAVTLPRAGNLGGGGFMLIYDSSTKKVSTIDYRSAAPKKAKSEMFLNKNGGVIRYGYIVTAVPGTVAGLIKAHEEHGNLSLQEVIEPSIDLASKGFRVTYDLFQALNFGKVSLLEDTTSKTKFYDSGQNTLPTDSLLIQPDLAKTLRLISTKGKDGFYKGKTAELISQASKTNGGLITQKDLASYEAKERTAIRTSYRGYQVVTMPPTASGGLVLLQTLNILENFNLREQGHNSANAIHLLSESMKRGYADRTRYHGDPDYFPVPIDQLINKDYSKERALSIDLNSVTPSSEIFPGKIIVVDESPDTTHFSVIDSEGNAVSNTYTLGSSFGSGVTVPGGGFLLNNQMRNFSHSYGKSERISLSTSPANRLQPGKRMISTQTPTIVFDPQGNLFMILGSPGGGRIPNIVAQVISNVIDHDMGYAEAVMAPRINQRLGGKLELETGFSRDTIQLLTLKGHKPTSAPSMGSVQAIFIDKPFIYGVADTRRPGAAAKGKTNLK
ncbi:MAG: gamma-glutamyltransferase [SAR86 cluster bacterium]|nr:gamma-glutamyltransferase [SAR86 cluster bacterium]|tara:strand:- start:34 stop:1761 length:1728 start_codon:yes stop_codon:yes gene_type:complete